MRVYTITMRVYIHSPQVEIAEIIADHLREEKHTCYVYRDFMELFVSIINQKTPPDLLIMDYLSYNHDNYSIMETFDEKKISLPVLFYNEPFLNRSTRAKHWKSQISLLQNLSDEIDLNTYDDIFLSLQNLIESKELRPYISLLQKPLPLPPELIKNKITLKFIKENQDDCICSFKERNKLPNNLFYLLQIFQKHRKIGLTLEDIVKEYQKDGKTISPESLKVLISRLKTSIRKDSDCNFLILHEKKTYKFIVYK